MYLEPLHFQYSHYIHNWRATTSQISYEIRVCENGKFEAYSNNNLINSFETFRHAKECCIKHYANLLQSCSVSYKEEEGTHE